MDNVSPGQASEALETVERARRQVIDQIHVPTWYWWGLAVGWIGLGLLTDLGSAWLAALATFVFGTVHASVAPRVVSGRHGSRQLSVRGDVAPHVARLVLGGVVVLAAATVGLALLAQADGARHPVTAASIVVAVVLVLGGPLLLGGVRRRAVRRARRPA